MIWLGVLSAGFHCMLVSRLAPGVLAELRRKNPVVNDRGRRKHKHFQWLTDDMGDPKLKQHLSRSCAAFLTADGMSSSRS